MSKAFLAIIIGLVLVTSVLIAKYYPQENNQSAKTYKEVYSEGSIVNITPSLVNFKSGNNIFVGKLNDQTKYMKRTHVFGKAEYKNAGFAEFKPNSLIQVYYNVEQGLNPAPPLSDLFVSKVILLE
jgi:hypothetical protein